MRHAPVDELLIRRTRILHWAAVSLLAVLAGRLWFLQLVEGEQHRNDSRANSVKIASIAAPRGLIRDRDGRLLVGNRRAYDLVVDLERLQDADRAAEVVARMTGADPEAVAAAIREAARGPERSVRVASNLLFSMVAWLEARQEDAPELQVVSRPVRQYPHDALGSHLLGYPAEISAEELERDAAAHRMGDLVGKTGVERQYDRLLTGRRGTRRIVRDALGREIDARVLEPPVRGADLDLTLDLDVQRAAEAALAGRRGACVVMDVRDGSLVALASSPAYEPETFVNGASRVRWGQYLSDPATPLRFRAVAGVYAPGSIWKPLVALAALQSGTRQPEDEVTCTGQVRVNGQTKRCWKKTGHGVVDLERALVQSCNVYFYLAGASTGIDPIHRLGEAAGFGRLTGIDVPEEKPGVLGGRAWKRRAVGEPWYPGDTVNLAIGQGYLDVTPLQVASFAAALGNGGTLWRPQLVRAAREAETGRLVHEARPESVGRVPFEPGALDRVRTAMERTVESGTGRRARIEGIRIAGKTGTAQPVSSRATDGLSRSELDLRQREHAWFMGFAPVDDPQVAFAVVVEHAGEHGGTVAAPVARAALQAWFARPEAGAARLGQ